MAIDPHTDEFDWDAFMRDTMEVSSTAAGSWLRCLYKMRISPIHGRLTLRVTGFATLFGMTPAKARAIIDELVVNGVANKSDEHFLSEETDLESEKVTARNGALRNSNAEDNAIVTLENRRMFRKWKSRNSNKLRQLRFRENKKKTKRNGNVTPPVTQTSRFAKNAKNDDAHIEPRARGRVRKEFKELREEEEQSRTPRRVTPHRLPNPFPITPEMWAWLAENIPDLEDPNGRHHDWVDHWTNETGTKGERIDWLLTWQSGMRKARKWQEEDRKNGTGKQNGNRTSEREKSSERNHNTREFADALERQALARMAALSGQDDQGDPEIDKSLEQPGSHRKRDQHSS